MSGRVRYLYYYQSKKGLPQRILDLRIAEYRKRRKLAYQEIEYIMMQEASGVQNIATATPTIQWALVTSQFALQTVSLLQSTSPTSSYGSSITTDDLGNTYVFGTFSGGSLTIGAFTIALVGIIDAFVYKVDSGGNILWLVNLSAPGGSLIAATLLYGSLTCVGTFDTASITLGSTVLTGDAGVQSPFIASINPDDGDFSWATSISSVSGGRCDAIDMVENTVDGDFYVLFTYSGTVTIASIGASFTSATDAFFVGKIDADGAWVWASSVETDSGTTTARGLTHTLNDNTTYVSGQFTDTTTFGAFGTLVSGNVDTSIDSNSQFQQILTIQTAGTSIAIAYNASNDLVYTFTINSVFYPFLGTVDPQTYAYTSDTTSGSIALALDSEALTAMVWYPPSTRFLVSASSSELYSMTQDGLTATLIGALTDNNIGGFALVEGTRIFGGIPDSFATTPSGYLVEINPSSGAYISSVQSTLADTSIVPAIFGLATSPNDVVYVAFSNPASSNNNWIGTIDISTAVITPLFSSGTDMVALTFDSSGNLWGATDNLATPPLVLWNIEQLSGSGFIARISELGVIEDVQASDARGGFYSIRYNSRFNMLTVSGYFDLPASIGGVSLSGSGSEIVVGKFYHDLVTPTIPEEWEWVRSSTTPDTSAPSLATLPIQGCIMWQKYDDATFMGEDYSGYAANYTWGLFNPEQISNASAGGVVLSDVARFAGVSNDLFSRLQEFNDAFYSANQTILFWMYIPDNQPLPQTICMQWLVGDTGGTGGPITPSTPRFKIWMTTAQRIAVQIGTTTATIDSNPQIYAYFDKVFDLNTWYFVAISIQGSTNRILYVDGVLSQTMVNGSYANISTYTNRTFAFIGTDVSDFSFSVGYHQYASYLKDFIIYQSILSEANISAIYDELIGEIDPVSLPIGGVYSWLQFQNQSDMGDDTAGGPGWTPAGIQQVASLSDGVITKSDVAFFGGAYGDYNGNPTFCRMQSSTTQTSNIAIGIASRNVLSISFWILPTSDGINTYSTNQVVMTMYNSTIQTTPLLAQEFIYEYQIYCTPDMHICLRIGKDNDVIESTAVLTLNQWYFITMQYSTQTQQIFINGVLDTEINVDDDPPTFSDAGIFAQYEFTSAGIGLDSSGNAYNMTSIGTGFTQVDDLIDDAGFGYRAPSAITGDGTVDASMSRSVGGDSLIQSGIGGTQLSIAFTVYLDTSGTPTREIFCVSDGATSIRAYYYKIGVVSDSIWIDFGLYLRIRLFFDDTDMWYHVAVTIDASGNSVYRDGVLVDAFYSTGSSATAYTGFSPTDLYLASNATTNNLTNMYISNVTLSASLWDADEVYALYRNTLFKENLWTPPILGNWRQTAYLGVDFVEYNYIDWAIPQNYMTALFNDWIVYPRMLSQSDLDTIYQTFLFGRPSINLITHQLDSNGNSFILGSFFIQTAFGGLSLTSTIAWKMDGFLVVIDSAGNFQSAEQIRATSTSNTFGFSQLSLDQRQNVNIVGFVDSPWQFKGETTPTPTSELPSLFMAQYGVTYRNVIQNVTDPLGSEVTPRIFFQSSFPLQNTQPTGSGQKNSNVVVDVEGNIYVCGLFGGGTSGGTIVFGTTVLSSIPNSATSRAYGQDIYLAKYTLNQSWEWALKIGGDGYNEDYHTSYNFVDADQTFISGEPYLSIDADDNIIITGNRVAKSSSYEKTFNNFETTGVNLGITTPDGVDFSSLNIANIAFNPHNDLLYNTWGGFGDPQWLQTIDPDVYTLFGNLLLPTPYTTDVNIYAHYEFLTSDPGVNSVVGGAPLDDPAGGGSGISILDDVEGADSGSWVSRSIKGDGTSDATLKSSDVGYWAPFLGASTFSFSFYLCRSGNTTGEVFTFWDSAGRSIRCYVQADKYVYLKFMNAVNVVYLEVKLFTTNASSFPTGPQMFSGSIHSAGNAFWRNGVATGFITYVTGNASTAYQTFGSAEYLSVMYNGELDSDYSLHYYSDLTFSTSTLTTNYVLAYYNSTINPTVSSLPSPFDQDSTMNGITFSTFHDSLIVYDAFSTFQLASISDDGQTATLLGTIAGPEQSFITTLAVFDDSRLFASVEDGSIYAGILFEYDITTLAQLSSTQATFASSGDDVTGIVGMAQDPISGDMWIVYQDVVTSDRGIGSIDVDTAIVTPILGLFTSSYVGGLAFSTDGLKLFSVSSDTRELWTSEKSIDPTLGDVLFYNIDGSLDATLSNPMTTTSSDQSFPWIAKINAEGAWVWQTTIHEGIGSSCTIMSSSIDAESNIYVGGYYNGTSYEASAHIDFNDSGLTISSSAYMAGWIAKLNSDGEWIMASTSDGTANTEIEGIMRVRTITTDSNGYIYVGGIFCYGTKPQSFNVTWGSVTLTPDDALLSDSFIIRLDADGEAMWGTHVAVNDLLLGKSNDAGFIADSVRQIKIFNDVLYAYVGGARPIKINGVVVLPSPTNPYVSGVATFNVQNGFFGWVKTNQPLSGSNEGIYSATNMIIDIFGNVILSGEHQDQMVFGNLRTTVPTSDHDAFVAVLSRDRIWSSVTLVKAQSVTSELGYPYIATSQNQFYLQISLYGLDSSFTFGGQTITVDQVDPSDPTLSMLAFGKLALQYTPTTKDVTLVQ